MTPDASSDEIGGRAHHTMKVAGMNLGLIYLTSPDFGVDALLRQVEAADREGFHSVWLSDHLGAIDPSLANPHGPLDAVTMMGAIAAVTRRVKLGWAMLNPGFRNPALLAKMITTLDHISHGRVICALGSGILKLEYETHDLPFLDDHDERVAYAREVALLLKELWTNVAPAMVTFEGKHVRTTNLQFTPAPYQKPHPPIWIGGSSDATMALVKELADGWISGKPASAANPGEFLASPDLPQRPLTITTCGTLIVSDTRDQAIADARICYEAFQGTPRAFMYGSFDDFVAREAIGDPIECAKRLEEVKAFGTNLFLTFFENEKQQSNIARLLLPRAGAPL